MSDLNRSKRSRASDVTQDKLTNANDERSKRRRTSQIHKSKKEQPTKNEVAQESVDGAVSVLEKTSRKQNQVGKSQAPWSLSHQVAGKYSGLDPVFTLDEEYLFLGLESAVSVYSMATSRLVRTLDLESGRHVIGYKLCPSNQDYLYIFTSTGVSKWDWQSGKQIWSWDVSSRTTAVDISFHESENDSYVIAYSLRERKDGKREIAISRLGEEKPSDTIAFETNLRITDLKVAQQGRFIVAYGGPNIVIGAANRSSGAAESTQYTWREATLPVTITSMDIRESASARPTQGSRKGQEHVDLVLGESNGSILIYNDVLNFFLEDGREGGKNMTPRRLHWHRNSVNTVRWSKDGNYVISGGQESVMVLWQLDSGRKQFLPHLSSPICNIVISPSGSSYVVKLADNCVMALSARELQPFASIIGLQICPTMVKPSKSSNASPPFRPAAASLHPQQPDQLLIAVPASRQDSQEGHHLPNSSVLQTYDIRTNVHISRQALSRTNATTLKISPEGTEIIAPDIKHLAVSQNGKWLATIDTWNPYPQDVKALDIHNHGDCKPDYQEAFLKFWKWNNSSSLWELATRIDGPHFSDKSHVAVLGLASRPQSNEFATVGADGMLRFWSPSVRQRSGLKAGPAAEQQFESWKCRSFIDLNGKTSNSNSKSLTKASLDFSDDGSVLAVFLPSQSASKSGLAVLVDAQNGDINYVRTGMFSGNPYETRFLGRHLVHTSKQAMSVWDIVDDVSRTVELPANDQSSVSEPLLLAVNSRTQTFAIATQTLRGNSKKSRNQFTIQIYDVQSLQLLFQSTLEKCPVSLLSDSHSGEYVVVDASANVKRFGYQGKTSQVALQPRDSTDVNTGLLDLFGTQADKNKSRDLQVSTVNGDAAQSKGLAKVFGDVPSFVLPSASVLFKDVVQSLC